MSASVALPRLVAKMSGSSNYLVQVPSNVWQYSPAWQKCQWRDLLAWHSQVFALTRPSGQC